VIFCVAVYLFGLVNNELFTETGLIAPLFYGCIYSLAKLS